MCPFIRFENCALGFRFLKPSTCQCEILRWPRVRWPAEAAVDIELSSSALSKISAGIEPHLLSKQPRAKDVGVLTPAMFASLVV